MKTQITAEIIGLKEDLEKEYKAIEKQVDRALLDVGVELKNDLQLALQKEWYQGYTPKKYKRRTDDNSLGTPLGSDENFEIGVRRRELEFVYEPTGEHRNKKWSDRDGDDLIAWIQSSHEYELSSIPARPFWNNFLDQQMDGGIMEKFIKGMSPKYTVLSDGNENLDELASEYITQGYNDYDESDTDE